MKVTGLVGGEVRVIMCAYSVMLKWVKRHKKR